MDATHKITRYYFPTTFHEFEQKTETVLHLTPFLFNKIYILNTEYIRQINIERYRHDRFYRRCRCIPIDLNFIFKSGSQYDWYKVHESILYTVLR